MFSVKAMIASWFKPQPRRGKLTVPPWNNPPAMCDAAPYLPSEVPGTGIGPPPSAHAEVPAKAKCERKLIPCRIRECKRYFWGGSDVPFCRTCWDMVPGKLRREIQREATNVNCGKSKRIAHLLELVKVAEQRVTAFYAKAGRREQ